MRRPSDEWQSQNDSRVLTLAAAIAMIAPAVALGCGGHAQHTSAPHQFGTNGRVVLQNDGKIVVPAQDGFGVTRYTPQGRLDSHFGTDGTVSTDVHSRYGSRAWAVAVQADHKIVALGASTVTFPDRIGGSVFAIARYLPDGRLDRHFGSQGKLLMKFGGDSNGVIAGGIDPNGKIVAVGLSCCHPYSILQLARYTSEGRLDPAFGSGGKVVSTRRLFAATDVALQNDGKIVLAGSRSDPSLRLNAALVRYLPNGHLDPGFGSGGIAVGHFRNSSLAAIAVQPDGKYVAAGSINSQVGLLRYAPDGRLDPDFGNRGKVVTRFGTWYGDDRASALAVQADGKIVVGGLHTTGINDNEPQVLVLARYMRNGRLDRTFGSGGKIVNKRHGSALGIAIERGGRIIVVALRLPGPHPSGLVLVRYRPDGSRDPAFGK